LKLTKLKTKSILAWDKINNAKWYNIYKKDETTWEYQFVEKVDTNRFVVPIIWKEIKYDYFKVKALCEKESKEIEAKEYSKATKIQTWPVEIILVLIAMLISWWLFFFINRKKS
jgi:fibronectin type 3 domain-containing protein